MKKNNIPEPVVIGIVWSSVMSTVEWNKKEELVAEQAIKHLKVLGLWSCHSWGGVCALSGYLSKVFNLWVESQHLPLRSSENTAKLQLRSSNEKFYDLGSAQHEELY